MLKKDEVSLLRNIINFLILLFLIFTKLYFTYEFRKATNLGKQYLLPKIFKKLHNVLGRPVTPNCGNPTEKFCLSLFLIIVS